jgi:hypothetical protein
VNSPVSDGHIGLKEIQFWASDEARYAYLINYACEDEERALLHDREADEVVYGVRREGTGIYCEIERRDVQNDSKFTYDSV